MILEIKEKIEQEFVVFKHTVLDKKFKFDFVELKVRKCFSTTDCTDYTDF